MAIYQKASPLEIETDRLDADFYRPEFVSNRRLLEMCPFDTEPIARIAKKIACGPFGSDLPSSLYRKSGVPLYRVQNVREGLIDNNGLVFLDDETSASMRSCRFVSGDILIAKSGLLGRVAFVPSSVSICNVTQDVIGVEVDRSNVDPHYLVAYFISNIGMPQIIRWGQGNVQQHLNMPSVRQFLWVKCHREVQIYIGDKVRQAERLRARARAIENQTQSFFALPEWISGRVGSRRTYRSLPSLIQTQRIDAPHYDPAHLHLEEILQQRKARLLSTVAQQIKQRWKQLGYEFLYFEIGAIDLGTGTIEPEQLAIRDAPSRAQLVIHPWDVLISTVRPNRKNVAIVPDLNTSLPMIASSGFSVLRFATREAAVFYHAWLRSDAATQQLMRWNAGGAYPAIEDQVPLSIFVPNYAPTEVEDYGRQWLLKFSGAKLAEQLVHAAKLLVEALIEGKLTEDELKTAREALARGDREPDRAILARLTRKGIDVPGEPPLFPDLDALYEALDRTGEDVEKESERK